MSGRRRSGIVRGCSELRSKRVAKQRRELSNAEQPRTHRCQRHRHRERSELRAAGPAVGPTVLVDFWAQWCRSCDLLAPVVEEIAAQQAGKVRVAKLNVDDSPHTAQQSGVLSIPTLIVFRGGEEHGWTVGVTGQGRRRPEAAGRRRRVASRRPWQPTWPGRRMSDRLRRRGQAYWSLRPSTTWSGREAGTPTGATP